MGSRFGRAETGGSKMENQAYIVRMTWKAELSKNIPLAQGHIDPSSPQLPQQKGRHR